MIHTYHIQGMTCAGCAQKIQKTLKQVPDITSVEVNLPSNQVTIGMNNHVPLDQLNQKLNQAGNYKLSEQSMKVETPISSIKDFLPLIVIFSLIILFTLFRQWQHGPKLFDAMHDFMGAFFFVFGVFKIINWKGFVESYRTYDILAKRSEAYAYLD